MRVTKVMVQSYIDRFNRHVDEHLKVSLAQRCGYYAIETLDAHNDIYTGMTIREAYTCIRGMLHAIGQL